MAGGPQPSSMTQTFVGTEVEREERERGREEERRKEREGLEKGEEER
jgi:hypothetical protein